MTHFYYLTAPSFAVQLDLHRRVEAVMGYYEVKVNAATALNTMRRIITGAVFLSAQVHSSRLMSTYNPDMQNEVLFALRRGDTALEDKKNILYKYIMVNGALLDSLFRTQREFS